MKFYKFKSIIIFTLLPIFMIIINKIFSMSDTIIGIIGIAYFLALSIYLSLKRKDVKNILFIGFLIRIILALLFTFILQDPDPDNYGYTAQSIMSIGFPDMLFNIPMGAYLYSGIVSILWYFFGESYLLIRVVNSFISFYSCVILYDILIKKYSINTSKIILSVACFLPALLRFSSLFPNREPLFLLVLMLSIKYIYSFYENGKIKNILYSILLIAFNAIIHISSIGLLIAVFGVLINKTKTMLSAIKTFSLIVVILILIIFMINNNIGTEKLNIYQGQDSTEVISSYQNGGAIGRASYLEGSSDGSIINTALMVPVRIAYFLFAPFIWMIKTPMDALGFVDSLFYIITTYYIYKTYIRKKISINYEKINLLLLSSLIIIVSMFGLVVSNYGTALRHRAKLSIVFLILSAPYIENKISKKRIKI